MPHARNASPRLLLVAALGVPGLPATPRPSPAPPPGEACAPSWLPTFGGRPGLDGLPEVLTVFDDGRGEGPALYAGGHFPFAGGVPVSEVARWDGERWSPLGEGVNTTVRALTAFDDGRGPALYAGGAFTTAGGVGAAHVARWDGVAWSPLGTGVDGQVRALAVYDDGSGPALYAGGDFASAGGAPAAHVARWDGAGWTPLGGGVNGPVYALTVFDDGNGPALYVGGTFGTAGGAPAGNIARWDGASWTPVGGGTSGYVACFATFDDGGGPALFVGGGLFLAGGVHVGRVARWDGTSWAPLGGGMDDVVRALQPFDDGSGSGTALYACGSFTMVDGAFVRGIARWDGAAWSQVGNGIHDVYYHPITSLAVHDDGTTGGPALFVGGVLDGVSPVFSPGIIRWSGAGWSALDSGGPNDHVMSLETYDDGGGAALYVGGYFSTVGGQATGPVARWDGTGWTPLPPFLGVVYAQKVFDGGDGAALHVGGAGAHCVGRWDGASWSPLGSGVNGYVHALTTFDDGAGPALYVGGQFTAAGGLPASGIARWDGASWSQLGGGVDLSAFLDGVYALAVFDDGGGAGPALYAGGHFDTVGGMPISGVARWDGTSWTPLGGGIGGIGQYVIALAVYDDGHGPALVVGGDFTSAGGVPAGHLARWDGATWSPVGGGLNHKVLSLAVHDDGTGGEEALYVGGRFTAAGGGPASYLARWDGTNWSALGAGTNYAVAALDTFDDGLGGGPALYAGGSFSSAYESGDSHVARWGCRGVEPPLTYCAGKTSSAGCVPFLTATGLPSASATEAFDVVARDVVPDEPGVLLYGFAEANLAFHGGTLCVKAPLVRTAAKAPARAGGGCSGWVLRRDLNRLLQSASDPALTAGATVFAQWRQRDPTDPAGFGDSLTNGVRFTVAP